MKNIISSKVILYLITAAALLSMLTILVSAEGIQYYGYEQLTDSQKRAYDAIHVAMSANTPETVTLTASDQVKPSDVSPAVHMYREDHPEVFWLGNSWSCGVDWQDNVVSIKFSYQLNGVAADVQTIIDAKAKLNTKLVEIDNEMATASLGTDAEKALWLHDKTAEIVDYVFTENDQTVYGALVEGQAVCSGYARLYQLLLQRNDISAYTVTGYSFNPTTGNYESHAWTLMWLDGKCLYTDVTWDDQGEDLYHLYYCRTLAEFSESHYPEVTLPDCKCSSTLVYDEDSIFTAATTPEEVAAMMLSNNYKTVLYFATPELYEKLTKSFLTNVFYALNASSGSLGYSLVDGCGIEVHLKFTKNVTLSGHVSSFGDSTASITLELFTPRNFELVKSVTANKNGDYSLVVPTGEYILRVKKANHVIREYEVIVGTKDLTKNVEIWLYGDVTLDGEVTAEDAASIMKYLARMNNIEDETVLNNADVTGDKEVTAEDAAKIMKYLARMIDSLS